MFPTQQTVNNEAATSSLFSADEFQRIQSELRKKLGPENVSTRTGAGNTRLSYIEGWRVISIANEIFGFNGWRSSIQNLTVDFMDVNPDNGRINVGVSCVIRITLRDGTYKEDIGYGMIENTKSKAQAFEKVKKEAVTDGIKRAMRQFGNVLGNCVYDKDYLRNVNQVQKQQRGRLSGDTLYRINDLEAKRSSASTTAINDGGSHENAMMLTPSHQAEAGDGKNDADQDNDGTPEFDMDEEELYSLMDELETNRPVIPDSPGVHHPQHAASASNQQTPSAGRDASVGPAFTPASSAPGSAGNGNRGANQSWRNPSSINATPQNTTHRKLDFPPPHPAARQAQKQRHTARPNATPQNSSNTKGRPKSFAYDSGDCSTDSGSQESAYRAGTRRLSADEETIGVCAKRQHVFVNKPS